MESYTALIEKKKLSRRRSRATIGGTISLYLILLVFFFALSSSVMIDPHKVKQVVTAFDKKVGDRNANLKRTFVMASFAGVMKLSPNVQELLDTVKNNPLVSSFVSNDKIVIQFFKGDFYDSSTNQIAKNSFEAMDLFFSKLGLLLSRDKLKLDLEFSIDSNKIEFDVDRLKLENAINALETLGVSKQNNRFMIAMKSTRAPKQKERVTISMKLTD